jgi:flavin-dependent dehydrogenase
MPCWPASEGYGWLVRKGRFLNIGLGRQGNSNLAGHVADFLAYLRREGKIPQGVPGKLHGHPYLLYDQAVRPLARDGALLIGDAAGLAYPKSGEGIRPAVESGLLAAQTIIEAAGRFDDASLAAYEHRILQRFGPRRAQWSPAALLPRRLAGAIAAKLFASQWFAREVVLNRWFFRAVQKPLAV